jgi:arabinan endo-1,5-alpha-L-arabinosidase
MLKTFPRIQSIFACAVLALDQGSAQSLNPAGSIAVHDPVLVKDGGLYYLFHTGSRVPVKTSPNLINWTSAGAALAAVPAWHAPTVPDNRSGDLWAPDVSFRNGAFWLYYSVSSFGSQTSAIGLATRTSLVSGAWQDQGMVITSATYGVNDNAIDPNAVTDTAGNPWLCWGSWWDGIFIVRLDPQTGKPEAGAAPIRIAGRNGGLEGAIIVHARGYYHLFASWDKCCEGTRSTYNMRYGRSTNVTGPYLDKTGKALTAGGGTLLSDGSGSPGGHNTVFAENGNHYLVYHVYDGRNNPASLQIRHLFFDAQNWPTLDPNASTSARMETLAPRTSRGRAPDWQGWFELLRGRIPRSIPIR